MRVLFVGGTGIISSACTRLAVERGIELFVLNRGRSARPIPDSVTRLPADIRDPETARQAIGKLEFDAVVDWVAFTPEHVEIDLALFRRTDRPVHLYQLGFGLPNATGQSPGDRVDTPRKPDLAVLEGQDRVRGKAHARLP